MVEKYAGIIIGMVFLSLLISVLWVVLIRFFPRCMFYTMLILSTVLFLTLIGVAAYKEIYSLMTVFIIILAIYAIFLLCYRAQIKTGIVLLEVVASFLTEKPIVYLIPLYVFLAGLVFQIFWVLSLLAIQYDALNAKLDK